MKINNRPIGPNYSPYVIAEMSANHNGSIESAFSIIQKAKECGADAIKIQTYRPDTITLNLSTDEFTVHGGIWDGRTLYDLYQEAQTPWEWHRQLFDFANKVGITIFSSPFDHSAVDLLEELQAPAYKIASFEAVDLPLIKYVASTKKPLIISTGMANAEEIHEAIDAAKTAGCKDIAILHCVSGYPAPPSDYNLSTIPDMIKRFGVLVGLSDHTLGNVTALGSVALGASIVEKHFTLNRNAGGPDDSFSIEPEEFSELCRDINDVWKALGNVNYDKKISEMGNVKFRRSLYFVKDLIAGEVITSDAVKSVRPGYGLAPKCIDQVINSKVKEDVKFGTPVSWGHITMSSVEKNK